MSITRPTGRSFSVFLGGDSLFMVWLVSFPSWFLSCAMSTSLCTSLSCVGSRVCNTTIGFHGISLESLQNVRVGTTSINLFWSQSQYSQTLFWKYYSCVSKSWWMALVPHTTYFRFALQHNPYSISHLDVKPRLFKMWIR